MIELVIAALLQIATITTDADLSTTSGQQVAAPTETAVPGGTGSWDDNG